MGKEHEHGCAECFKGYLLEKGHVVCYEPGPDAPDYIFTIDGEKYSVEVTEIDTGDFLYDQNLLESICKSIEEKVQRIRKDSKCVPQTGRYWLDFVYPRSENEDKRKAKKERKKKTQEQINRVAEIIACAKFLGDAIENDESHAFRWRICDAECADTLCVRFVMQSMSEEGEICDGANGAWQKLDNLLAEIMLKKKGKIEEGMNNAKIKKHKGDILLLFGLSPVLMEVLQVWKDKSSKLKDAAKKFDCILLIWKDKDKQYKTYGVLIPFNRRS